MGEVTLSVDAGIATIRLDRPPMNALNVAVQEGLRAAAHEVSADTEVYAVIVYGGEKVFAAGADIKEMAGMSYVDMVARAPALTSALDAIAQFISIIGIPLGLANIKLVPVSLMPLGAQIRDLP